MVLLLLESIACDNLDWIPAGSIVEVESYDAAMEMIAAGLAVPSYDPRAMDYEVKRAIEQSQQAYMDIQDQIAALKGRTN